MQWRDIDSLQLPAPGSSDSPASASQVVGITGRYHYTWLIFVFLVEMGFLHIGQADLEQLISDELPTRASQSDIITVLHLFISYLFEMEC